MTDEQAKTMNEDIEEIRKLEGIVDITTIPDDLQKRAGGSKMIRMTHFAYQAKYAFVNTDEEIVMTVKSFLCALQRANKRKYIEELLTTLNK